MPFPDPQQPNGKTPPGNPHTNDLFVMPQTATGINQPYWNTSTTEEPKRNPPPDIGTETRAINTMYLAIAGFILGLVNLYRSFPKMKAVARISSIEYGLEEAELDIFIQNVGGTTIQVATVSAVYKDKERTVYDMSDVEKDKRVKVKKDDSDGLTVKVPFRGSLPKRLLVRTFDNKTIKVAFIEPLDYQWSAYAYHLRRLAFAKLMKAKVVHQASQDLAIGIQKTINTRVTNGLILNSEKKLMIPVEVGWSSVGLFSNAFEILARECPTHFETEDAEKEEKKGTVLRVKGDNFLPANIAKQLEAASIEASKAEEENMFGRVISS